METGQYNNLISVSIAVFIIITCLVIAYLSEKYFFSKQKDIRTKDALNKQNTKSK